MNTIAVPQVKSAFYIPSLDGLRFFAFLLVFVHHSKPFGNSSVMQAMQAYGWVGVELFFVISSFLFFHLLSAEQDRNGRISVGNFYIRRFLRIYPLMILFPLLMMAIYGSKDGLGLLRIAGLALFLDNIVIWFKGYNWSVPASGHLWTLSFEFQIYIVIPFVFMLYKRCSPRHFLAMVAAFYVYCVCSRMTMFYLGAKHPAIWVTPILRPESILLGILLFAVKPRWHWSLSLLTAVAAGSVFLSLAPPWGVPLSAAVSYPLGAVMCAGIVDASLRSPPIAAFLSNWTIRNLGRISFGLYVFHTLGIALATGILNKRVGRVLDTTNSFRDYGALFSLSLLLTVAMALASYWLMERWIDRLKRRFTIVVGRP